MNPYLAGARQVRDFLVGLFLTRDQGELTQDARTTGLYTHTLFHTHSITELCKELGKIMRLGVEVLLQAPELLELWEVGRGLDLGRLGAKTRRESLAWRLAPRYW